MSNFIYKINIFSEDKEKLQEFLSKFNNSEIPTNTSINNSINNSVDSSNQQKNHINKYTNTTNNNNNNSIINNQLNNSLNNYLSENNFKNRNSNNNSTNPSKFEKSFENPVDMVEIISTLIDNNEKYPFGIWISIDKDIFINISELNLDKIIRYLFERYPY